MPRRTTRRARWAGVTAVALVLLIAGATTSCSGDAEPDGAGGLPIAGRLTAGGTEPEGTLPADVPPPARPARPTATTRRGSSASRLSCPPRFG